MKKRVLELLKTRNLPVAIEEICRFPPRVAVNPLFALIQEGDERLKWGAVKAMGAVVASLAEGDMEAARVILRRLMWNLNDESGGIGWGSPEAMGEILASHDRLAREYTHILISYLREDGNLLENEVLQSGVLWGIGRVAEVRPGLVKNSLPLLRPFLDSPNPTHRGLAVKILGLLRVGEACSALEGLTQDDTELLIFSGERLEKHTIGELAIGALRSLEQGEADD